MADNEGTDSSVRAESASDAEDADDGDPEPTPESTREAGPSDDSGSPETTDSTTDDESRVADDEATGSHETVVEPTADEGDVDLAIEDEDDLVERVSDHDEDLGEAVEAVVDRALDLGDRVAELETELEARETKIESLESTVEDRDEEIDDLTSRLKRKQADFQNYKKRAKKRQQQIRDRATEDLVERLVDVRNDLTRALDSDHDDVESFRDGVEMTLREFDRVLDDEDVEEIAPDPGDDVDPQRHEVMMQVDSDRPEGAIHDVYDSGYEMAGKILQPARVTVSNGANHDPDDAPEEDESQAEAQDTDESEGTGHGDGGADSDTDADADAGGTDPDEDDETDDSGEDVDEGPA
jgi:molecular chaperone GrpE